MLLNFVLSRFVHARYASLLATKPQCSSPTECFWILGGWAAQVLQKGMQGGDNTPPDGNMDWLLNEKHRRGKHLEPLGAGPSDVRKKLFRFCMSWSSNQALEFGGCFGIRDPESQEMMCAALCFPPNEQKVRLWDVWTQHLHFGVYQRTRCRQEQLCWDHTCGALHV